LSDPIHSPLTLGSLLLDSLDSDALIATLIVAYEKGDSSGRVGDRDTRLGLYYQNGNTAQSERENERQGSDGAVMAMRSSASFRRTSNENHSPVGTCTTIWRSPLERRPGKMVDTSSVGSPNTSARFEKSPSRPRRLERLLAGLIGRGSLSCRA